jgi:hypothetical protein
MLLPFTSNQQHPLLSQASRDVTNSSKKIIFLLHRIVTEDLSDHRTFLLRAKEKLGEVQTLYAAMKDELQGDRYWRHQRQVSPGLQEYIEALSFTHYLEHGTLIKFDQVQDTLRDSDGVPVRTRNYCLVYWCTHNTDFVCPLVVSLVFSFDSVRLSLGSVRFDG